MAEETENPRVTATLVRHARSVTYDVLPPDVRDVARHCLLDWLGCALAGSREPLAMILAEQAAEWGGTPEASLVGLGRKTSAPWAALVNGAASHALDFDDTHLVMMGHPSVPVVPALLALSGRSGADGRTFVSAFVVGVETECRLGALMGPGHYAVGWHATSTLGAIGAAAACAHLLGLDDETFAHAIGLAATQASGVKSVFGTMSKPFHAGRAAMSGLMAASLAARGFTSDPEVISSPQGFASTHTTTFEPGALERYEGRWLVRDTVFKYHAACYLTHSAIEAALALREEHKLLPDAIAAVEVLVPPGHLDVCNIAEPRTGLEGKFSLRTTTAMALLGTGTDEAAFTDERMLDPELVAMRDRVSAAPSGALGPAESTVRVMLRDGAWRELTVDTGRPASDLRLQWERLTAKFVGLASPVVGEDRAWALHEAVSRVEEAADVGRVLL